MTPGWAVSLIGDSLDLDEFREMLKPPFDPWTEDFTDGAGARLLLRSGSWSSLAVDVDVLLDARRIVELLNGEAFLNYADAKPVICDAVLRFDQSGALLTSARHITLIPQSLMIRSRGHATLSVVGQSPPVQQASHMQQWLQSAASDPLKADLFASLSRLDNWYNLYKAMEIFRYLRAGGHQNQIVNLLGGDFSDWDRVWQTANSHRHAPNPRPNRPLPMPIPTFEEAKSIVSRVIRAHL